MGNPSPEGYLNGPFSSDEYFSMLLSDLRRHSFTAEDASNNLGLSIDAAERCISVWTVMGYIRTNGSPDKYEFTAEGKKHARDITSEARISSEVVPTGRVISADYFNRKPRKEGRLSRYDCVGQHLPYLPDDALAPSGVLEEPDDFSLPGEED